MLPRTYKLLFFVISTLFMIIMFASPLLNGYASLVHLDGTPGYMDHWDLWSSKDPITCAIYSFGDIFCHQEMDRSYVINGSQMPVCVRDVGMVIGFVAASAFVYLRKIIVRKSKGLYLFFIVSFLVMLIDWLIQHSLSLNVPFTRLVTGLLVGVTVSLILSLFVDRTFEEA